MEPVAWEKRSRIIRGMEAPGLFDHLRHSALELLASGNSTTAVAGLLQVPASLVARWRDEPVPPPLEPAAMLAAQSAQGRPVAFRTTLVVSESMPHRLWNYALAVYVAVSLAISVADEWGEPAWQGHGLMWINAAIVLACALWLLKLSRPLLSLDARAIVVPGIVARSTLAYPDLADWWLVGHVLHEDSEDEREGRLLTLHSRRPHTAPITVFIDDRVALDPRVLERLELVNKANQGAGPLARLGAWKTASSCAQSQDPPATSSARHVDPDDFARDDKACCLRSRPFPSRCPSTCASRP